jgi:tetratricopeptide (TPR) repeat protein
MGKFTEDELKAVEWFNGGYALMTSGLYEKAIEAFNEAINLDPNIAGFYTMRGYSCSKIEKYKEALEDFTKAIELGPEDAQNYSLRGAVLGIMGNQAIAMENIKVAASMGDRKVQEILKRKGFEWHSLVKKE